ncbi:GDYXXLXY domain-containing protein [Rhizobium sp. CG5]|uniref:GDYXXLXY domain-containing protein n=1 Tax=Rhizobium sp. CG5 TaxID=2726076 RepID=UPI002033F407|nr:GDYXXLXY domain-containing protein [Rhizobium sp. CG5]MCM2472208.1 GDYXXLXY domain-containing protein [Rhizobium sp. CG5]
MSGSQRGGSLLFRVMAIAVLVSALQTAVLGYQIETRARILRSGTEILLKTVPVDPRDLLRGEYVVLSYDISRIPAARIVGDKPDAGEWVTLWVRVAPQPDGFWTVSEASFAALPQAPGTVLLKTAPFYFEGLSDGGSEEIFVHYGIERFYVPEGDGKPLEEARNDGVVSIAVRVGSSGSAQIRQLLVDGQTVYEEPQY